MIFGLRHLDRQHNSWEPFLGIAGLVTKQRKLFPIQAVI
jgi:hypothetical protein